MRWAPATPSPRIRGRQSVSGQGCRRGRRQPHARARGVPAGGYCLEPAVAMPLVSSSWGSGDGVGWRAGSVVFRAEALPLIWRGYCSGETSWMKVAPSHPARIKAEPLTKFDTFMRCEIGTRNKMFEGKLGIVKNYFGFPKNSFPGGWKARKWRLSAGVSTVTLGARQPVRFDTPVFIRIYLKSWEFSANHCSSAETVARTYRKAFGSNVLNAGG